MPVTVKAAAPPASKNPRQSSAPKTQTTKRAEQREALEGIVQLASFGLIAAKQYADAGAVSLHGPKLAHEVANLAETNERVAAAIAFLTQTGPYAALIAAGLPLVMQLGANHGKIEPGIMGTVSGGVLEAQVKTELAKQEQEAVRLATEAQQELDREKAEWRKITEQMDPEDRAHFYT